MKTGPIAALIACAGVFIPLICGALLYMVFMEPLHGDRKGFIKRFCWHDSYGYLGKYHGRIVKGNGKIKGQSRYDNIKRGDYRRCDRYYCSDVCDRL